MDKLGFSPANRRAFEQLIHKPHGMILVSGPVNSGKTTTLYAALRELSSVCSNIVTLEDPVEYCLPGINQIPVGAGAKLTFPLGLRAVLRQDITRRWFLQFFRIPYVVVRSFGSYW
jgi:type II secretory ATPase GspE/PulE/Tfp pilus assembly ATPase PilB-like protein